MSSETAAVARCSAARLEYTECVIKETLRLLPTIPIVARRLREDMDFNGKVVPAGSTLLIHILALHRDPRHYEDPLRFDPDRFSRRPPGAPGVDMNKPPTATAAHPYCFLPFGAGPRSCIGQRYAMMKMKAFVATVLRRLRVVPVQDGLTDPARFPLTFDMTLRIVGGTRVRLSPRIRSSADGGAL